MPRVSEKFRITRQLQETWLAYMLSNILLDSDDMELIQQFLSPSASYSRSPHHTQSFLHDDVLKVLFEGEELGVGNSESEAKGFEAWAIRVQDEELEEFIGLLGMIIPEIRYLAPGFPISRSEYLFIHHVS